MQINWPEKFAREGHRIFLSGLPIAMHCHHYNINLLKTIEDSLGEEGADLIYRAAEQTSYSGFCAFLERHRQLTSVKSKFELAATSYQYCGLGLILFKDMKPEGGRVVGHAQSSCDRLAGQTRQTADTGLFIHPRLDLRGAQRHLRLPAGRLSG